MIWEYCNWFGKIQVQTHTKFLEIAVAEQVDAYTYKRGFGTCRSGLKVDRWNIPYVRCKSSPAFVYGRYIPRANRNMSIRELKAQNPAFIIVKYGEVERQR